MLNMRIIIINVFTVTFDPFNVSLVSKNIKCYEVYMYTQHNMLNKSC